MLTQRIKIFSLTIFLLSPLINFAQTEKNYDKRSYKRELDSLQILRTMNINSKVALMNEIKELKRESLDLDEKISKITSEIETLYTIKFGKEIGARIYKKQIWKGMTEKMLLASWGNPDKIEKNVEKWGTFTQWYYGNITFFFRDSKLVDWEELK